MNKIFSISFVVLTWVLISLNFRISRSQCKNTDNTEYNFCLISIRICFSVVAGTYMGKMVIWSIHNRTVLRTINAHTGSIYCLRKINSSLIASAGQDEVIKLWRMPDGQVVRTLTGHDGYIWALEVFNNQFMLSGSLDKSIRMWNINTGQLVLTRDDAHTGHVLCLKILNNGKLASGSTDRTVKFWNPSNLSLLESINSIDEVN